MFLLSSSAAGNASKVASLSLLCETQLVPHDLDRKSVHIVQSPELGQLTNLDVDGEATVLLKCHLMSDVADASASQ